MALTERLELDISAALQGIGQVEQALTQSAQNFKVALADALDVLGQVKVEADASQVTAAIDEAVASATTTAEINVDGAALTTEVDDALAAADASLPIDVDTAGMTADIDQAITSADAQVPVSAETDAIAGEIQEAVSAVDPEVTVTADTAGLADEITSAVADIPPIEVPVEADTSDAVAGLNDLTASSGPAAAGLDGVGLAAQGVSAGAAAATGDVSALGAAAGNLAPELAGAAAGTAAVATGLGVLIDSAIESDTATNRLTRSAGEFAAQINGISIDGFADGLTKVAERAGQDDEALRLANARLFDLAKATGQANPELAASAENMTLLATRIAVFNPTAGQAGDIMNTLTTAFANGRTRGLAPYGISLDATAISQRALADSGKTLESELTRTDKVMAGIALTTEQFGGHLKADIVEGSKGAEISVRSFHEQLKNTLEDLGKPLIAPFLQTLREGQPIILELSKILGTLGEAILPAVVVALKAFAPTAHLVAVAVEELLGPVIKFEAALERHPVLLKVFEVGINAALGPLGAAAQGFDAVTGGAKAAGAAEETYLGTTAGVAAAEGLAAADAGAFSGALADQVQAFNAATTAANIHAAAVAQNLGPLLGVQDATIRVAGLEKELDDALNNTGKSAASAATSHRELANAHHQVEQAERGVTDAEEALNRVRDEEIPAKLAELNEKVAKSAEAVTDAERGEADAQTALNELQTTTIPEELAKATEELAASEKAITDAQRAEADEQEKLNHLRDVDIPRQLAVAERDVEKTARDLVSANRELTDAQDELNNVTRDYADTLERADISAERAVLRHQEAISRVDELRKKLADLTAGTGTAAGTSEADRNREIARTQRDIANAQLDVRETTLSEKDAQKDLADVRGPGQQRAVADATAKVGDAQRKVTDATEAQTAAQEKLNDLQNGGVQRQLADAERSLSDAHEKVTAAVRDESAKREELNRLQTVEIPKQLEAAERALEAAHRGVRDATDAAGKAQDALNKFQNTEAPRLLEAASRKLADAIDGVARAQDGLTAATDKGNAKTAEDTNTFDLHTAAGIRNLKTLNDLVGAREDLITKLIAEGAPQATINALKQEEIEKLEKLKRQHPELTQLIDNYIAKINQIPSEKPTKTEVTGTEAALQKAQELVDGLGKLAPADKPILLAMALKDLEINPAAADKLLALQKLILGVPTGDGSSGSDAITKLLSPPTGRASGGQIGPGDWVLGEAGREILHIGPNGSGWVLNNRATEAVIGGGGMDMERMERLVERLIAQQPIVVNEVASDPVATARAVSMRQGLDSMR